MLHLHKKTRGTNGESTTLSKLELCPLLGRAGYSGEPKVQLVSFEERLCSRHNSLVLVGRLPQLVRRHPG